MTRSDPTPVSTDHPPAERAPSGSVLSGSVPSGPAAPGSGDRDQRAVDRRSRRLFRSRRDRMVGGVCGGIGRYLDLDPVLLRIGAVALALSGGLGLVAYIVAWIVIPEADGSEPERVAAPATRHDVAVAVGAALVGLGATLLLREWLPGFGAAVFWPLVVVASGVLVLVSARR